MLALYHAPLATTPAAVLAYRAIQLWLPALLGTLAFVQLRRTLRREAAPAAACAPLAEITALLTVVNLDRFNAAFGIGSAGFSEGMVCVRPERPAVESSLARSA